VWLKRGANAERLKSDMPTSVFHNATKERLWHHRHVELLSWLTSRACWADLPPLTGTSDLSGVRDV
jgi:hypothetical protein